jgi:hypothetical protein
VKYLNKSFSVPVAPPDITQEEWDAIFGPNNAVVHDSGEKKSGPPSFRPKHNYRKESKTLYKKVTPRARRGQNSL